MVIVISTLRGAYLLGIDRIGLRGPPTRTYVTLRGDYDFSPRRRASNEREQH